MMVESVVYALAVRAGGGHPDRPHAPRGDRRSARGRSAGLDLPTQLMISLGAGIYEELLFRVLLVSAAGPAGAGRLRVGAAGRRACSRSLLGALRLLRLPLHRPLRRPARARLVHLPGDGRRAVQRALPAARLRDHRVDPRAVRRLPLARPGRSSQSGERDLVRSWVALRLRRLRRVRSNPGSCRKTGERLRPRHDAALDVEARRARARRSAPPPSASLFTSASVASVLRHVWNAVRSSDAESAKVRKNSAGALSGAQVSWFRKRRSCTGQNLPCFAAHIATSAAGRRWGASGSGKLTKTQRTLPVGCTRARAPGRSRARTARQYGHWKSDISYTVTGAEALPLVRAAIGSCGAGGRGEGQERRAAAGRGA